MANQFREIRKLPPQQYAKRYSGQENLRVLKQVGRTTIPIDRGRPALLPGKRVSRTGSIYWETRKNRSDAPGSRI